MSVEEDPPTIPPRWRLVRKFQLADAFQIMLVIAGIGGAVWTTAVWTNNWNRELKDAQAEIEKIKHEHESFAKLDLPKQMNLLTYRLDQNDQRRLEDIAARRQFETDARASLDKIIETVVRLQIRLGDGPGVPMRPR